MARLFGLGSVPSRFRGSIPTKPTTARNPAGISDGRHARGPKQHAKAWQHWFNKALYSIRSRVERSSAIMNTSPPCR
jgi:hypothetical protein